MYNAAIDLPLEDLIQQDYNVYVIKLRDFSKDLLSKSIKVIEDADFKSNEILNNTGNFFTKIGTLLDNQKTD